jgi:hypothetical protein
MHKTHHILSEYHDGMMGGVRQIDPCSGLGDVSATSGGVFIFLKEVCCIILDLLKNAEDVVFPFVNPPIGESGICGTSQAYPTLDVEVLQAAR